VDCGVSHPATLQTLGRRSNPPEVRVCCMYSCNAATLHPVSILFLVTIPPARGNVRSSCCLKQYDVLWALSLTIEFPTSPKTFPASASVHTPTTGPAGRLAPSASPSALYLALYGVPPDSGSLHCSSPKRGPVRTIVPIRRLTNGHGASEKERKGNLPPDLISG